MSGRRRRVVTAGAGAVAAVMCLAAAATVPGVRPPTPLASYATPGSTDGCASKVMDDWVDDGRVQGIYRMRCYREAIKMLPEDLRAYSSAPDDLERAMRTALHRAGRTLAHADP